jgi:hypothetical protein
MNTRTIPILLGALALLAALPAAEASTVDSMEVFTASASNGPDVMINNSEFVDGNSAKTMMLVLPTAGELTLNFTDMDFTGALDAFEFGLSNTSSPMSGMIDGDSMTIDFTKATTFYLDIFARGGLHTGFGLYDIWALFDPKSQPQPVPLPTSGISLAGGLAGLLWMFRRRRPTTVMTAVA